jgi:hypothetical protein
LGNIETSNQARAMWMQVIHEGLIGQACFVSGRVKEHDLIRILLSAGPTILPLFRSQVVYE